MTDYKNGVISGVVGLILSHPIDTIKTYKQSNIPIKYNINSLYKGITAPLISIGLEKAIVFGTYHSCRNNNIPVFLSGAISGFLATFIVTPYERIKILKQTNHAINWSPKFLFRGLTTSFTREIPGFAIYFQTYETFKYIYKNHNQNNNIPLFYSFITGGISGSFAWIFIYPQDRIKTIIQSNSINNNPKEIYKSLYKLGGVKELYKGFSFAIGRAMLLHSGAFATMEYLKGNGDLEIF